MGTKTSAGNFFENFRVGQQIVHATPRTITVGDVSLYTSLYGSRFPVHSSDALAQKLGLPRAPVDDLLAFHIIFGKTVPDISLNAVANLGYAQGKFLAPVYPGDTVSTRSTIIGLKQNSSGKAGVVYLRSTGRNQRDEVVLDYVRWVMVTKKDPSKPAPDVVVPELANTVPIEETAVPVELNLEAYDFRASGSFDGFGRYEVGERIDHIGGMTIEEAEHQMATRLYQNTARIHFDAVLTSHSRFGKRLVYGGHIISVARSLSFNGLANAFKIVALNGGTHAAPTFAGDTIYAWSEVLDKHDIPRRKDVGALRLRTVAVKNQPARDFPYKQDEKKYAEGVVLDLDYTVLIPR